MLLDGGSEWTFLVYAAGDNDLATHIDNDIAEIQAAVSPGDDVSVVVFRDGSTDGDTVWGDSNGTFDALGGVDEWDSGSPETEVVWVVKTEKGFV